MVKKNLIKPRPYVLGFVVLFILVILSLILSLRSNITGNVISAPSVDVKEDLTADLPSIQIAARSPYKPYEIYSLDLTLKKGDVVYLDGQVEVTNNAGQNVLVGTYINVNGNRIGYYSTENVIPAVHHLPLRTSAIYTADSRGNYKFSLVSYAGSGLVVGKTLKVEQGYGHLAAIVFGAR